MRRCAGSFSGCSRRRCASGKMGGEEGLGTLGRLDDKLSDCAGGECLGTDSLREDGGEENLLSELREEDWL